jgi:PAS domain S-box-containing protein
VNSYGYNYEELLGMTVKDLRAPEFLETADTQMAEADAHGSLFETVHRRKDGSTFPVEVSSQGATINGTRTLISVIRDITERKRADDVLRESRQHNEFLANILELSSQPFAVRYPDGLLGLFNEAFEQLTGYTGNELKAIDKAEILTPPEWREIDREKLKELRRTGRPVTYEKEYIRKDNSRVPVQMFAHFVTNPDGMEYYYAFITDITERKQAEKLIQQHLEELRSANEDMALFNDAAVGRELRMIELKREINKLCAKAGLPQRYEVDINEDQP